MKLCQACRRTFSGKEWKCLVCGHQPGQIGEFRSFAPESSVFNEHFPPDSFQRLAPLEEGHFWFRSRNELIVWALRKWFSQKGKLMEIGCGTGYVLSRIERDFPDLELCGSEIYAEGLKYASKRLSRAELIQMDALNIPYQDEFNIIGMFDSLEHIKEDENVLTQVHQALVPGGGLLLTLPQHPFLWSYLDEFSGHFRRYEKKEIVQKVEKAGFKVLGVISFVSVLFPLMLAARMAQGNDPAHFDPGGELKIHSLVNFILGKAMNFERLLIRYGVRFPWGGSLMLAAQKN